MAIQKKTITLFSCDIEGCDETSEEKMTTIRIPASRYKNGELIPTYHDLMVCKKHEQRYREIVQEQFYNCILSDNEDTTTLTPTKENENSKQKIEVKEKITKPSIHAKKDEKHVENKVKINQPSKKIMEEIDVDTSDMLEAFGFPATTDEPKHTQTINKNSESNNEAKEMKNENNKVFDLKESKEKAKNKKPQESLRNQKKEEKKENRVITADKLPEPNSNIVKVSKELVSKNKNKTLFVANASVYNIHEAQLIKNQHSNEMLELKFTVIPLEIPKNKVAPGVDIAVHIEGLGKVSVLASEKGNRRSITATIGSNEFIIRGAFKDGAFKSYIYPTGKTREEYQYSETITHVRSKNATTQSYELSFIKNIKDLQSKVYIFPITQINEPTGLGKVIIIMEREDKRMGYIPEEHKDTLLLEIKDFKFRVYGKWEQGQFISNIDQI